MISYEDALGLLQVQPLSEDTETLSLVGATGRRLAVDLVAKIPSPPFTNSAMDGFAFCYDDVRTGSVVTVEADIYAAPVPDGAPLTHQKGACVRIMTGALVPDWADTVIPVEATEEVAGGVLFKSLPEKGAHIRHSGEDAKEGQLVIPKGTLLNPEKIMVAAAFGYDELTVYSMPRVAIFSTGDELKIPGEPLPPGAIYNSSRYFLEASLQRIGLCADRVLTLGDDHKEARAHVEAFMASLEGKPGLMLSTGAVSAGTKDFLPRLAQDIGFTEVFHKVAIRPGKPVYFAKKNDVYWLGLPGNAVSTCVGWHFFVRPLLAAIAGIKDIPRKTVTLKNTVKKPEALRCFYRAEINGNKAWVPEAQGSARLMASVSAGAYVILPEGCTRVSPETELSAIEI